MQLIKLALLLTGAIAEIIRANLYELQNQNLNSRFSVEQARQPEILPDYFEKTQLDQDLRKNIYNVAAVQEVLNRDETLIELTAAIRASFYEISPEGPFHPDRTSVILCSLAAVENMGNQDFAAFLLNTAAGISKSPSAAAKRAHEKATVTKLAESGLLTTDLAFIIPTPEGILNSLRLERAYIACLSLVQLRARQKFAMTEIDFDAYK